MDFERLWAENSTGSSEGWDLRAPFAIAAPSSPAVSLYHIRRLIGPLLLGAIALTAVAWYKKGDLVTSAEIGEDLLQEPRQRPTTMRPFEFEYKGQRCRVKPVATYELWGLVVSHNDIESIADFYHDSTSVDTKDLCVVWGGNLESDDFREVEYTSGSWTCYFRYPVGVKFAHHELGNNHLITDDPAMRDQIARVRVGDQIHLEGLLVDYQMDDWQNFWRRSSTVRDDTLCEVVFVEHLEVLRQGTPGWYSVYRIGKGLIVTLPVLYLVVFWLESGRPDRQLGKL